jgi:predicted PurR-regulated permease PerM
VTDEQWRSRLVIVLVVAVSAWLAEQLVPLVQSVGDILLLFFLAWIVAFILAPVVGFLERRRIPRTAAVGVVYITVLLGLVVAGLFLVPILIDQLKQAPDVLGSVTSQIPTEASARDLLARFGVAESTLAEFYRPELLASQIQAALGSGVQGALSLAASALAVMANLLLVIVLSFYMLLDAPHITLGMLRLVPTKQRSNVILFMSQWSASFGGFIRGQVIQAVLFGAVAVVVMVVFRLGFVVVAALSSTMLMLFPIVGPVLALIPPMAVALFAPSAPAALILLILIIVQAILVNAVMPRVLSKQMGVHPLLVLFAILIGLRVGGLLGSFFAVPIMGVIYGMAAVIVRSWQTGEEADTPSRV